MSALVKASRKSKFNRADIVDIARGGKIKKRVKKDSVIALIARADRIIEAYTKACNVHYLAVQKLADGDGGWPHIGVPDELLNIEWHRGYLFNSERHIDRQFRAALKRARQRIREGKASIKAMKPGHGAHQIILELEQRIAGDKRRLLVLPKYIKPLKQQYRKEARRLHKAQTAAGVLVARKQRSAAWRSFRAVTEEIAKAVPTTKEGALALIGYVERRSWCERPELFSDEGDMPGSFGMLLRRSLAVLTEGGRA